MNGNEFQKVKDFLNRTLDAFAISYKYSADRVAVVSHGLPEAKRNEMKSEFGLLSYNTKDLMKAYVTKSIQQFNGEPAVGSAMEWMIKNIFLKATSSRKHKVIIVVSAGETSEWNKEMLKKAALEAKCRGYALFVISAGQSYNSYELEELASVPLAQHLIQLGRIHKPELDYAAKLINVFVHLLRSSSNSYPPENLKERCSTLSLQRADLLVMEPRLLMTGN
ncbi:collagen alpha-6(VI) chain-like [Apteryx mantelli]|uniref:Collagen alpha-6(VI) chain-like n=1 Tax=Apteryx mantelli TaxID=2696672 RepID=A0A8B7J591_9AVES|nr:PREDICTED: collagen alpha-6(VI) chain-like [Apteryx mantelli mantelli]